MASERTRRSVALVVIGALVLASGISYVETWSTTSYLPAVFGSSAFAFALLFSGLGWTGRRRRR